ncbi:MAG: MucR family transcriptional regulator, partial [Caulobacteraceae bacterium]|nr:MucR family transcriptional regulator [Caulobacteraceae bacterium]
MPTDNALQLAAGIVSSFVQHNQVASNELPALIASVHHAIANVGEEQPAPAQDQRKTTPAQVRKSIMPEALISFEDGKPYRLLKRHLRTLGLTPEEYRAKWGLPA